MEQKKKNYNLLVGVIALLAIVVIVAVAGYMVSGPEPAVIQGQAEAAEYRVSGKVPGRIGKFFVNEGDYVHEGDTLVEITSPEVKSKLAQAMAVKSAAEAQKDKAMAGARQEQITAAYELWQKAAAGEEADMQFICDSKSALMCYATPTPQIDEPSAGYIFTWDMLGNGSYTAVDQYEGENGTHSEFIEGLMSTDMRKTADDLATFFSAVV